MIPEDNPLRLSGGMALLEAWAADADQADKNAAYEILFAVADGSITGANVVVSHQGRSDEIVIVASRGLVLKINFPNDREFRVHYIGFRGGRSHRHADAA